MATGQSSSGGDQGELSDIKRKLAWRMGFAVLMIVALLGGLALFDYFSARVEPESSAPQFTEPVPVAKKAVTQPVTPAEPVKEEKAEPEASAAPVDKSAASAPQRPEVAAQPSLPRATPAPARPVSPAPSPAPARPAESRAAPAPAAPARSEAAAVAAPAPPPSPPRLFSGYALQAGVFSDPRRAEELHARLTLEGIPSTIEARVQVGPFRSRSEAETMRAKLDALGIDAVMLPPKGAKR